MTVDIQLARRLEMTDALAGVEYAEAWRRRQSYPDEVAIEVAGGRASFAGVDSPITQAFALGFEGPVTEADIEEMELFYRARGSAVNVETCPLADASLFRLLGERGYRSVEESNVLARTLSVADSALWPEQSSAVQVRTPAMEEAESYSRMVAGCFFEGEQITQELIDMFASTFEAAATFFFLAEVDGEPAAGAMMSIHGGVATIGGAGTLPAFRNRGAQRALILARLSEAARQGCDLAMVATGLNTTSQRNVERQGFNLVYMRTKFLREWK